MTLSRNSAAFRNRKCSSEFNCKGTKKYPYMQIYLHKNEQKFEKSLFFLHMSKTFCNFAPQLRFNV